MDDFKDWKTLWTRVEPTIAEISEESRNLVLRPAADPHDVAALERDIGRELPQPIRRFFLECTKQFLVYWWLKVELIKVLPPALKDVSGGDLELSLEKVRLVWAGWPGWEDAFLHPELYGGPPKYEYDALFPFETLMNGDLLALVVAGPDEGFVTYLSHDLSYFDWSCLGSSFVRFLENWTALGCVGPYRTALEVFYDYRQDSIALDSEPATVWKQIVGL